MIEDLERRISYRFSKKDLLEEALTHPSYAHEKGSSRHSERLEFLGDAVIGLIITDYLLEKYPEKREGELARIKGHLVSKGTLAYLARRIGLGPYIFLGSGDEKHGVREKESTLANAFEALIGAIYLDGGFEKAKSFLLSQLEAVLSEMDKRVFKRKDPKTELQEILQKRYKALPRYEIVSVNGPEHEPTFKVRIVFRGKVLGVGMGRNKKEAEKNAAREALSMLNR